MAKVVSKITWTWKKIFGLILGLLGIGTLTSCYGMPIPDGDEVVVSGIVMGDIDGDGENEPVEGITVSTSGFYLDYANTDSNGKYELCTYVPKDTEEYSDWSIVVDFRDMDGEENGSFQNDFAEFPRDEIVDGKLDAGTIVLKADKQEEE